MIEFRKRQAVAKAPGGDPVEGETRTAMVHRALQADITEGRLHPGEKLGMQRLCQLYGVGLSPLREALSRLVVEGLVTLAGHRGFSVAPISVEGIRDLARVRSLVECTAFTDAMQQGDDVWEAAVVAAFHRLARATERAQAAPGEGVSGWEEPHRAFHAALTAACPSPLLLSLREDLDRRARFYRLAAVDLLPGGRDHLAEHRALMQAAIDRDAERGATLLTRHLDLTAEAIAASLSRRAAA